MKRVQLMIIRSLISRVVKDIYPTHRWLRTPMLAFLCILCFNAVVYSQGSDDLVQIAMAQSGSDALFIREFKANLRKGTLKNPVPSAKFNVYLKENTLYRFNVANDKTSDGDAILQLFENGRCLGNTFDEKEHVNNRIFEYKAQRTGNYQVIVSFKDGKQGNAVGIMSMITSAATKSDSIIGERELEVLYLNVDNPVSIVTDKEPSDSIILTVDNGTVRHENGNYFIKPLAGGLTTLSVTIKDSKGKIKEEAKSDFLVRRLPFPAVSVQGLQGGIISRSSLQLAETLNIDYPFDFEKYGYSVVDFVVKSGGKDERRIINNGKEFHAALKTFLVNLPEESRLTIESIHVRTPEGQIISPEPLAFIVR
ncbi:MAG TPA: GldM family protein [Bacteroidales bacterium]|nr:GldM family protein [Bacteroidales bacterium]